MALDLSEHSPEEEPNVKKMKQWKDTLACQTPVSFHHMVYRILQIFREDDPSLLDLCALLPVVTEKTSTNSFHHCLKETGFLSTITVKKHLKWHSMTICITPKKAISFRHVIITRNLRVQYIHILHLHLTMKYYFPSLVKQHYANNSWCCLKKCREADTIEENVPTLSELVTSH